MRFVQDGSTELSAVKELLNCEEIAVPAAVVIDGKQAAPALCELNQFGGLCVTGRKRLVDDHVAAGEQALLRQLEMGAVWSGDDHEANGADCKQVVNRANEGGIWILGCRLGAGALNDDSQSESGDTGDDGRVKSASGETKADESDVNHGSPNCRQSCA